MSTKKQDVKLNGKKKCLIYARTSTSDQDNENQLIQLRDYASTQGWEIVEVVTDVCSGSKSSKERSGLQQVFNLAYRRRFSVLLFFSLDRLSREGSRKTIEYLTRLEEYGVDWHSYSEQYLSSLGPFSDCVVSLLSCLAKQERIRISERTKAGLERTRRVNGTRLGRPRTPDKKVRQAVRLRRQGLSYSEIGEKMGVAKSRAHQLVAMTD